MDERLPGIVVTGASGFVGRHFLEAAGSHFRLFCIARRSQFEAGVPRSANLRWTQVDIGHHNALLEVSRCILGNGGAEYVLHLAGFYDFTYEDHPEYERTNVEGTRNVLALADALGARHFIYASSLAACSFPPDGSSITEDSPPDATFPYARSKRDAEAVIRDHDASYTRSIVRFAALYSDWCEYPPVYAFLKTWSSGRWNARVLGGRGRSAVPYLHIKDLNALLLRVIDETPRLPALGVYSASPRTTTSHEEMYSAATKFLMGRTPRPLHIPRWLALPGIAVREGLLRLLGHPPFERTWMVRYIDRVLRVDPRRTEEMLHWKSTPRYDLPRRLLLLIENMKSHPEVWIQRNEAAFLHPSSRPNLVLYNKLLLLREELVERIYQDIRLSQLAEELIDYRSMNEETLSAYVSLFYEVLITTIRTRDRTTLRTYARILAYHRFRQRFRAGQVCETLCTFGHQIRAVLALEMEMGLSLTPEEIHDNLDLSIQLACDEVEDVFEQLHERGGEAVPAVESIDMLSNSAEMQRLIDELNDICRDGWEIKGLFGKPRGKG
ncbi:MAG: NAD(P)-dependent oxidoreductase [Bacteroidetes bacterium]|nr:NAD(P)-dependent oxidoreductase [Bacteroidota bacterium]